MASDRKMWFEGGMTGIFTYPDYPCCVCGEPSNWAIDEKHDPAYCDKHNKDRLEAERLERLRLAEDKSHG